MKWKYETFNYGYDGHSNSGIFNCMGCWYYTSGGTSSKLSKLKQAKTAAAERISEQGLYAMRDVQVARLALFHGDQEKAKELTNEASPGNRMMNSD